MAFAVEIALRSSTKRYFKIHIKDKQQLYHALTDRETLCKIIEQALDYELSNETFSEHQNKKLCEQYQERQGQIVDCLMNIRTK